VEKSVDGVRVEIHGDSQVNARGEKGLEFTSLEPGRHIAGD